MAIERYIFEELTLSQSASLGALYQLYCSNFPLPEEQETYRNFLRCLELNDDSVAQSKYGPYHEFYLVIREWDAQEGMYDEIVGGLIFGVCTSSEHLAHGFRCSVQAIYLFRTGSESLKRFLYAGKTMVEETVTKLALKACGLERFRSAIGNSSAARIAMLFEVNNPNRLSPEERQRDRDLSHLHPALRYVMWLRNHTRPLAFHYVQPPLSADQQPAEYLDLFAVESLPDATGNAERLSPGPAATAGLPGPVLAAHLQRFFCISVLKGDAAAIDRPCLRVPSGAAQGKIAVTVDAYCRNIAATDFVPLVAYDDAEIQNIKTQATESSITVARERAPRHRHAQWSEWLLSHWFRLRQLIERFGMWLGLIVAVALVLQFPLEKLGKIPPWLVDMMDYAHVGLAALAALGTLAIFCHLWFKAQSRRKRDFSPLALHAVLQGITKDVDGYRSGHVATALRDILSDRATNHLTTRHLFDTIRRERTGKEIRALSRFLASRSIAPYLADFGLSRFDSEVEKEVGRLDAALTLFPPGVLQALDDLTPWHAYYTCVFPVRSAAAEGPTAYQKLEDFDVWIDRDVTQTLLLDDSERARRLEQYRDDHREACLFVSHILDQPWDEADPGSLFDTLGRRIPPGTERPQTGLDRLIARHWIPDAEIACARMLAVVSHLASVMGRMAENRQVTTNLYCRCRVLIHVTAEPSVQLMRNLGFQEVPRPEAEAEEAQKGMLNGTLLVATLEPGAESFSNLLKHNPTAAAFFGLIDEMAKQQRSGMQWPIMTPGAK
jgi:hypothetical protein